jgi:hypothetical protein
MEKVGLELIIQSIQKELEISTLVDSEIHKYFGSLPQKRRKSLELVAKSVQGEYSNILLNRIYRFMKGESFDNPELKGCETNIQEEVVRRVDEFTDINLKLMSKKEQERIQKTVKVLDDLAEKISKGEIKF